MADVNFIEFYDVLSDALTERTSPQINLYEVRGVHLLPNNPLPYIQTTNVSGGIELEDWTVYVVNTWDLSETDISDYFIIEDIFTDDNGDNQFTWSITNIPNDFGNKMVYLKAVQSIGDTFYSNMFQLTENNSEKTTRIDYKSYDMDTMQSIQLNMWYWQSMKSQELSNYYETSTKNTVTNVVKSQRYEHWLTDRISNSLFLKITDVFEYKYVYVNLIKSNLFENAEITEHSGTQNYARNMLKLSFNSSDVYNPLANPILIVDLVPTITLTSVVPDGSLATYSFTLANFTPDYLTYQYSDDEITWISTNYLTTNPQNIIFTEVGVWYFRISHPLAVSNTIMIDVSAEIDAINDTVQVPKGGTIDIHAMFNDVLAGETLITAVGTATNGTTSIIESGAKVRYVHDDSATTSDSFTYTISNGIDSDTATINIEIGESTSFLMSFGASTSQENTCLYISFDTALTYYYASTGLAPTVGDRVYKDELLTSPVTATQEQWHKVAGGKIIKLDVQGNIIELAFC